MSDARWRSLLVPLARWQRTAVAACLLHDLDGEPERRMRRLQMLLVAGEPASAGLLDRLCALRGSERTSFVAAALAGGAGLPSGADSIHPSWRAGQSSRPVANPRVALWLERARSAELVAMPEGPLPAAPTLRDLPRVPATLLLPALAEFALRQLAWGLQAARETMPAGELARVASVLPGTDGARFVEHLAALRTAEAAPAHWGTRRAALARARGLRLDRPHALLRLAGRALAARITGAGGDLDRQLAQRLPRQLGALVLDELTGPFRCEDLAQTPRASALFDCLSPAG